jgi:hypothetical protein
LQFNILISRNRDERLALREFAQVFDQQVPVSASLERSGAENEDQSRLSRFPEHRHEAGCQINMPVCMGWISRESIHDDICPGKSRFW